MVSRIQFYDSKKQSEVFVLPQMVSFKPVNLRTLNAGALQVFIHFSYSNK